MSGWRVAVATTTRADYGHLYWLLRAIQDDPTLDLLLYVSGSHLDERFGSTVEQIEQDGLPIRRRIEVLVPGDTPAAACLTVARVAECFGAALADDRPAVVVLLGDRYEILPIAQVSVLHGIPVAHLHGGEVTAGALDDSFRHAVTKLATLHFTATEAYRRRVLQLGEPPERVHALGAPGLDHVHRTDLLARDELERHLRLPLDRPTALVTYHPPTADPTAAGPGVDALIAALLAEEQLQLVFTGANADPLGRLVDEQVERACRAHPERCRRHASLGTRRYLSCLRHLDLLVGNSSSALIEAPSFGIPAVDVGDRQRGRVAARNVVRVGTSTEQISAGIRHARSPAFRAALAGMTNPYDPSGDGRVSERIARTIRAFLAQGAPPGKAFVDLPSGGTP